MTKRESITTLLSVGMNMMTFVVAYYNLFFEELTFKVFMVHYDRKITCR